MSPINELMRRYLRQIPHSQEHSRKLQRLACQGGKKPNSRVLNVPLFLNPSSPLTKSVPRNPENLFLLCKAGDFSHKEMKTWVAPHAELCLIAYETVTEGENANSQLCW